MEENFIQYNEALALRGLNFNEPCFANYYTGDKSLTPYRGYPNEGDEDTNFSTTLNSGLTDTWVTAPLYQQAFKWFREKHKLLCWIETGSEYIQLPVIVSNGEFIREGDYSSYEKAELACLKKLIEIVKKENEKQI